MLVWRWALESRTKGTMILRYSGRFYKVLNIRSHWNSNYSLEAKNLDAKQDKTLEVNMSGLLEAADLAFNAMQNPRLKQIHFHTLRHFFATKLFDQTKSLPLVQEKLDHRNINSTMVYTHLVEFDEESQNYYHTIARDEKEAGDLIDRGFTYVCTTPQGIMMFRKRK
jgi:integrase